MPDNQFTGSAFNQSLAEGKIMGTRCRACGALHLPPRPICPACLKADVEWLEFGKGGCLLAYSVIFVATTAMIAEGFGRTNPYCTGIVKMEEGPAISAQILGVDVTHPEQITIGMPLSAVFIDCGEGEFRKTRLAFEAL